MRKIALLLSLVFPLFVAADVKVIVKIESPQMMNRYRPRTVDVEQEIAGKLAELLPSYFRHWSYAGAPSTATPDYRLTFRIHRRGGEQVVTLVMSAKNEICGTWDAVWMPVGELAARGFPDRTTVGSRVAANIAEILLNPKQPDIGARMKAKIPVAIRAQWQRVSGPSESPRLVVPLRWPGSRTFVNSKFRVKCEWPGKGTAELHTTALNEAADYDDAESRSSYKALTLKPLRRIFEDTDIPIVATIVREVRALRPIVVYLEDDDTMGLDIAGGER